MRRRLLLFLIPALSLLVVGAAALAYHVALRVATSAYDRSLLDPALDIAANIENDELGPHLAMQAQAQEALLYDHEDSVVFQVRAAGGAVVIGDERLPPPPSLMPGERAFFDGRLGTEPVRIAAVRSDAGMYVQVAETLHKRTRLVRDVVGAGLLPALLIAAGTLALAWTGVARGLAPLTWIRTQLLARTPHDLRPLDERAAPIEIAPAIEALNRLFAKLHDANASQQRFLANAAHQLRTPLAGLRLHLELLLRRDLAPDLHAEIASMHAATVRAGHLANQLLALAKTDASVENPRELLPIDLHAIANSAVHEWVQRAIERGIDLGFVLDHAWVSGDPMLLGELLDNLLDNALRYAGQRSSVTVRCGYDGEQAYLSVEDDGPGIPESERARVFERFYRVPGAAGDGAGLGLAIVKEVVARHRGRLDVESAAGLGTRIVVRFPSARPETAAPRELGTAAAER